jgi:hypothetical protein
VRKIDKLLSPDRESRAGVCKKPQQAFLSQFVSSELFVFCYYTVFRLCTLKGPSPKDQKWLNPVLNWVKSATRWSNTKVAPLQDENED